MIFFVLILWIFYILLKKKDVREKLFITTIVCTVFFYTSCDPIVGMPIYFEVMLISILATILRRGKLKISKTELTLFLFLTFLLIIQMLNLEFGHNVTPVILLKESDTDVMDIAAQLIKPTLDFTVIKHFVFYIFYLIFVLINKDFLRDREVLDNTFRTLVKGFKVLFICLIVESLVVNALGGYNDRPLMQLIFGFKNLNMPENWRTFGIYSVAFSFTERSYMGVIIVYYLIQALYKKYDKEFLKWYVISVVAVFCTGSSTALMVVMLFSVYFFGEVFVKGKSTIARIGFSLALIAGIFLLVNYSSMLLSKINIFFDSSEVWSSGYFRRQSITYGLEAIRFSPLIGMGIGTVYAHSMIIQTVANIVVLGVLLAIAYHKRVAALHKLNFDRFCKVVITLIVCSSTFTVQEFTSPLLLCLILGCLEDNWVVYRNLENTAIKEQKYAIWIGN